MANVPDKASITEHIAGLMHYIRGKALQLNSSSEYRDYMNFRDCASNLEIVFLVCLIKNVHCSVFKNYPRLLWE